MEVARNGFPSGRRRYRNYANNRSWTCTKGDHADISTIQAYSAADSTRQWSETRECTTHFNPLLTCQWKSFNFLCVMW